MNSTLPTTPRPRTYVYIDGFNLYYGALKGKAVRWLDLSAFCRILLPKNDVRLIKYFTARVSDRPSNPGCAARQQAYLRALATCSDVEVYFGHYLSHEKRRPLAADGKVVTDETGKVRFVSVLVEEEKGSDVNLAAHLMHDAHRGLFDVAVVISNDSDLTTPIELVCRDLGLVVGVVNPHSRQSVQLRKVASFLKGVREGALKKSQFPESMTDAVGTFHKPAGW